MTSQHSKDEIREDTPPPRRETSSPRLDSRGVSRASFQAPLRRRKTQFTFDNMATFDPCEPYDFDEDDDGQYLDITDLLIFVLRMFVKRLLTILLYFRIRPTSRALAKLHYTSTVSSLQNGWETCQKVWTNILLYFKRINYYFLLSQERVYFKYNSMK